MDIQRISQYKKTFDDITHEVKSDNGEEQIEIWFARELQSILGYARWKKLYSSDRSCRRFMQVSEYQRR